MTPSTMQTARKSAVSYTHLDVYKRQELTKPMAAALLKNGRIKMKGLFSEKKGVLYDAVVVLADTGEKYVNYKIELSPRPKTKGKE